MKAKNKIKNSKMINRNPELIKFVSGEKVKHATLSPLYDKELSDFQREMDMAQVRGDNNALYGYGSAMSDFMRGRAGNRPRNNYLSSSVELMNAALPRVELDKDTTIPLLYRDIYPGGGDLIVARHYTSISAPYQEYKFIWSKEGDKMVYLDGSIDVIFKNLAIIDPKLNADNVVEYLTFLLSVIDFNGKQMTPIKSLEDIKSYETLSTTQRASLEDTFVVSSIKCNTSSYRVTLPVIFNSTLRILDIKVESSGRFEIVNELVRSIKIEALKAAL